MMARDLSFLKKTLFLDIHGLKNKRVHVSNGCEYYGIGTYLGEGLVYQWHVNGTVLVEVLENEILASVSSNDIIEQGAQCRVLNTVPIILMDNKTLFHDERLHIVQVKI